MYHRDLVSKGGGGWVNLTSLCSPDLSAVAATKIGSKMVVVLVVVTWILLVLITTLLGTLSSRYMGVKCLCVCAERMRQNGDLARALITMLHSIFPIRFSQGDFGFALECKVDFPGGFQYLC